MNYVEACRNLASLKKDPEYAYLGEVSSIALQQSLRDATRGVENFFRDRKKNSPPQFKKLSNRQSFRIVEKHSFRIVPLNRKWAAIKLPKLADPVKFRLDRKLPGEPSSLTIIKERSGEYFVSFVVEVGTGKLPQSLRSSGIDFGLTDQITVVSSDGIRLKTGNPRFLLRSQRRLKRYHQNYSSKEKGSKNQEKARRKMAKQYKLISNQRKDNAHKLTLNLIRNNQTVGLESLNIQGMLGNHQLAKHISDASWGIFKKYLFEKAEYYGREVLQVDRYFPSSKTCAVCGSRKENGLGLSDRSWECIDCGTSLDRDYNAALNILLAVGSSESINAYGGDLRRQLATVDNRKPDEIRIGVGAQHSANENPLGELH